MALNPRHKTPHQQKQHEQQQKTNSGLKFVIFFVLGKRKRSGAAKRELRACEPGEKQRNGFRVFVERRTVMLAKLPLFPAHDDGIKQRKVGAQNER
jgi:hypothetical protein